MDEDTPTYEPSAQFTAAFEELERAETALKDARKAARKAVAVDLLDNPHLTSASMAPHTPWTYEVIRGIAREFDVPPKRKPTVKSIKSPKRATR